MPTILLTYLQYLRKTMRVSLYCVHQKIVWRIAFYNRALATL